MSKKEILRKSVDTLLDLAVVPGFTRAGYLLRGYHNDFSSDALCEKTVLVTGANSGVGKAAAQMFFQMGADVHMLVRDLQRGSSARNDILRQTAVLEDSPAAKRLILQQCDLASLADIRRFGERFSGVEVKLDVLVNNAGVLPRELQHSVDGIELTFATNVAAPCLLTGLLLPLLRRSSHARVIIVASAGMYTAALNVADPQLNNQAFDGPKFYAHTKRAEVVLTEHWASCIDPSSVSFYAMHPGWAATPGLQVALPSFYRFLRPLLRAPYQAADTVVWLGSAPLAQAYSGGFWHDRRQRSKYRLPGTRETLADREKFWEYCKELVGLDETDMFG